MERRISRAVLAAVAAEATRAGEHECCGLLLASGAGAGATIDGWLPARNVAADPARRFEIDPAALIAAHRAQRGGGPHVAGCYHSHPGGDASPSPCDAAAATPDGQLWLIHARGAFGLWIARGAGARHGRFDQVRMVEDCGEDGSVPAR